MERVIIGLLRRLGEHAAVAGCALLLLSAGVVSFEVVARRLFGFSLVGADELAGYSFAIALAWGYGHALFERSHIRVDVVYLRLPLRVQRWLDVVAAWAFTAVVALVVYHAVGTLAESWRLQAVSSTPLAVPLWIPQTIWVVGLWFFLLCLCAQAVTATLALVRGDLETVKDVAAPLSVVQGRLPRRDDLEM